MLSNSKIHIISFLVFTLILYSSGQAFLLNPCECCNQAPVEEVLVSNCCEEESKKEKTEKGCHSKEFSDAVKFVNYNEDSCNKCSIGCSTSDNYYVEIPTLIFQTSFELKKQEIIKTVYNFDNKITIGTKVRYKPKNSNQNIFQNVFGKDLLIKLKSLKIPTSIS